MEPMNQGISSLYRGENAQTRRALRRLRGDLLGLYQDGLRQMKRMVALPDEGLALATVNREVGLIHCMVKAWLTANEPPGAAEVSDQIRGFITATLRRLEAEPVEFHRTRQALTDLLVRLNTADRNLANCLGGSQAEAPVVRAPVDLLYAAHAMLFPAERMLVASGRRDGGVIALTALFDVTGECQSGYVRADPAALGRALIAMDASGSFLAAWLHSHPGDGPQTAHPSQMDRNQYSDWLRHYSQHLLCGIFVNDGWLRFWGDNLETGRLLLVLVGEGIQQEDLDEPSYRLCI